MMQKKFPLLVVVLLLVATAGSASAQTRVDRSLSVQVPASRTTLPSATGIFAPPASVTRSATPVRRGPTGAYTSNAMGPSILARNADYETVFRLTGSVASGATISRVSWRYGLSARPAGLDAVLCLNRRFRCWNVTDTASGSTAAFNGMDATQEFTLHYRVKGSGPIGAPVQGAMNQLIVTFDLPP